MFWFHLYFLDGGQRATPNMTFCYPWVSAECPLVGCVVILVLLVLTFFVLPNKFPKPNTNSLRESERQIQVSEWVWMCIKFRVSFCCWCFWVNSFSLSKQTHIPFLCPCAFLKTSFVWKFTLMYLWFAVVYFFLSSLRIRKEVFVWIKKKIRPTKRTWVQWTSHNQISF